MAKLKKGRDAKIRRQEAATERDANKRTPKAQMAHLDREGFRAKKERQKLNVRSKSKAKS